MRGRNRREPVGFEVGVIEKRKGVHRKKGPTGVSGVRRRCKQKVSSLKEGTGGSQRGKKTMYQCHFNYNLFSFLFLVSPKI